MNPVLSESRLYFLDSRSDPRCSSTALSGADWKVLRWWSLGRLEQAARGVTPGEELEDRGCCELTRGPLAWPAVVRDLNLDMLLYPKSQKPESCGIDPHFLPYQPARPEHIQQLFSASKVGQVYSSEFA